VENDYRGWFPHEELTGEIIAAFYYVYNQLDYGFLESVYAAALARTLIRRGHRVAREVRIPVRFDRETACRPYSGAISVDLYNQCRSNK